MSILDKLQALMIEAEQPTAIEITHPVTGEVLRDAAGKPATLSLLSNDSEIARNHERRVQDKRFGGQRRKLTAAEVEADAIELICQLTKGWYLVSPAGEMLDVPFSLANARLVYNHPGFRWLLEAASAAVSNRENFPMQTAPNSATTPATPGV